MKTVLIVASIVIASASAASAVEVRIPLARHIYTCEGTGLSRVALQAHAAPCCTGMLGCPQLLANTGLLKPKRDNRT